MTGDGEPSDPKLKAAIKRAYDALELREARGEKPNFVPDMSTAIAEAELVSEFTRLCRNQPVQILKWMREFERMTKEPAPGLVVRPSFKGTYGRFLGALEAHVGGADDDAAAKLLRDSKAIRNLLAPGGGMLEAKVQRQRQSRIASKKRSVRPLKRAIDLMRETGKVRTWDDLLEVFEDGDQMGDLYYSTNSPIDPIVA